jgi:hypothetical protein
MASIVRMPFCLFNELAGLGRGGREYSRCPALHKARALRSDGADALENVNTRQLGCRVLAS